MICSDNKPEWIAESFHDVWQKRSTVPDSYVKPAMYLKISEWKILYLEQKKTNASTFSEIIACVAEIITNKHIFMSDQLLKIKNSFKQMKVNYEIKSKATLLGRIATLVFQKLGWWKADEAQRQIGFLEKIIMEKRKLEARLKKDQGVESSWKRQAQIPLKNDDRYESKTGTMTIQGISYKTLSLLSKDISKTKVASIDSSAGDMVCVMDPGNSPQLIEHYRTLFDVLIEMKLNAKKTLCDEDVLNEVKRYVKTTIFPFKDPRTIKSFIEQRRSTPQARKIDIRPGKCAVVISIEQFIGVGIGGTHQHALATSYLLDCLIRDGILKGQVHHFRCETNAWVTYTNEAGRVWHFDSVRGHQDALNPKRAHAVPCQKRQNAIKMSNYLKLAKK